MALVFRLFLFGQPVLFLLKPRGVISLPRDALAAVELEYPARDIIEKITVVRDGDDRPLVFLQMLFEPRDGFGIEMIGRLVKQQNIGFLQQQAAQRDAPFFTAAKGS